MSRALIPKHSVSTKDEFTISTKFVYVFFSSPFDDLVAGEIVMVAGAGQGPSEKSSFILFFVVAFHLTTLWRVRSSVWRGRAGAIRKVIAYVVLFWPRGGPE